MKDSFYISLAAEYLENYDPKKALHSCACDGATDFGCIRCSAGDTAKKLRNLLKRRTETNVFRERFERVLPEMRKAAKKLGYAITTHGSMERDFDIVVVPWAETSATGREVAHAIRDAAGSNKWRCPHTQGDAPYGREWWPFDWADSSRDNQDYVDMSVFPSVTEAINE